MNKPTLYDVVIVGGGPAGLSAAIYSCRNRAKTLLIEKGLVGGMINETEKLDNYPGFPEGISGMELTSLMYKQAQKYELEDVNDTVSGIKPARSGRFTVATAENKYTTKTIIVCAGSDKQKMDVPGEKEFTGRGVAYCATCDAPFYKDKQVAVVGGGNTALYEAMHLAKFARKVTIIHRRAEFRATPVVQDQVRKAGNIDFLMDSIVETVEGQDFVENLVIKNVSSGKTTGLAVDGVFVAIGLIPNTAYLAGLVELDKQGMIIVNDHMETSVPGIFAAGDVRHGVVRRVASAVGQGAVAVSLVHKYLETV